MNPRPALSTGERGPFFCFVRSRSDTAIRRASPPATRRVSKGERDPSHADTPRHHRAHPTVQQQSPHPPPCALTPAAGILRKRACATSSRLATARWNDKIFLMSIGKFRLFRLDRFALKSNVPTGCASAGSTVGHGTVASSVGLHLRSALARLLPLLLTLNMSLRSGCVGVGRRTNR